MAKLYELTDDYISLYARLDDCTCENEAQEILGAITAIEADIVVKAENYARIIRNKAAEADAYAGEIKRLTDRKKAAEASVERLKANLAYAMEIAGINKITTSIGAWTKRVNPPSVQVTNEDEIPDEYKIAQPAKIDKKAILLAYKLNGEIIPGTDVVQMEGVQFR